MATNENFVKKETIVLQKFVKRLLEVFQPILIKQKSFIVNNVPDDLIVSTDPAMLATVIKNLFYQLGQNQNSCMFISAKCYNNVVLFRITGVNSFHDIAEIKDVQSFAEALGGCITLNTQTKKGSAIIFSFIDFSMAA